MLAAIRSAAVLGVDAYDVTVEVDVSPGLPQWTLVGLPAAAVKESRERVAAALANAGFAVPPRRVTVNLAPGEIQKTGTGFDVPIALGILVATGQLPAESVADLVATGELGLDGTLRAVRGTLPIARRAAATAPPGAPLALVVPPANAGEAALVSGVRVHAPASLGALAAALAAGPLGRAAPHPRLDELPAPHDADFTDVVGQAGAKRALEVAAAGAHNLLLVGPPGAGKTMLARRLPTILPALTEDEALAVIAVHSVAGTLPAGPLVAPERPFRAPHHTVSTAGLIGGGSAPRPGEVSLAHHGVLFLDELLEFPRHVLDALRQPLEDGRVTIARAATAATFPARFTLVGATNPCPCGAGPAAPGAPASGVRACTCSAHDVARYRARLSGPLADRIDMHVTVGAVPVRSLGAAAPGEPSAAIRARVEAARARQRERYRALPTVACNAHAAGRWLHAHTPIDAAARDLLDDAAERLGLSARGYHRVLRVARTIADLDASDPVTPAAVSEALRYRPVAPPLGGAPTPHRPRRTGASPPASRGR